MPNPARRTGLITITPIPFPSHQVNQVKPKSATGILPPAIQAQCAKRSAHDGAAECSDQNQLEYIRDLIQYNRKILLTFKQ